MATRQADNSLPPNHPLRSASWIWPGGQMYTYNTFAQFRRDFHLSTTPRAAPFFITADQAYRLWVNGEYVCRGPARGYQSHWPFDEVDIAPYLRRGRNWIAVLAHNPGISTFQYRHQGTAGLLCAGRWGRTVIVSGREWRMRRMPGQAAHVARLSLQLGFQEHCDARTSRRDWIDSAGATLGDWDDAPERLTSWDDCFAFARPPYDSVEPRGIPLMAERLVAPVSALCESAGPCGDGYREWENVSWGWVREMQDRGWKPSTTRCTVRDDTCRVVVRPTGAGRWRAVTLDAGEYRVGTLMIRAAGAAGGEIVDFHFHENTVDGAPGLYRPGAACQIALANRLVLREGATSHEFFQILGFRYVTVVVRGSTRPIRLDLSVRHVGYPFTMRGGFECSDTALNAIYDACRRTQQICSLDAYVDTPWREQGQWWGDARVQGRNTFYLDGDARLLARGIRSIAGQTTVQGLTYGHAPTIAYNCILPDFSLTWILTIWDHYWQTGDLTLFSEQWPRIQQVLAYFDSPDARTACGLLRHDTRLWYFGDWANMYKGEVPTFLNLWYLLTLRRLAELLARATRPREAGVIRRRAVAHERLVMSLLFDRRGRRFCGGLDANGRQADHTSVHDQVMALMLDLAPQAHQSLIDRYLLPYLRGEPTGAAAEPSAFWSAYAIEEMARRGYASDAIAFIRHRWLPMTATGTTWEGFTWKLDGGSASHAWTAHPSWHFVNILAGIRQTSEAWKSVEIAPAFVDGIDHVKARVPSPRGEIALAWNRQAGGTTVRFVLPKGVRASLRLPGVEREFAGGREHVLRIRM